MDLTEGAEEAKFRLELRAWLEANDPGQEPLDEDEVFAFRVAWQRRLNDAGYVGLTWPVEYGGRGLSPLYKVIFTEEVGRAATPDLPNFVGVEMTGPVLMAHGTDAQRDRYLPSILGCDEIWCQGFSEPEAGSDLASLRTRAVAADDGWRIEGQKIWTSGAHRSDRCLLLARTGSLESRHRGLSFFILDLDQSGVDIRPLRQMTGDSDFNEVFFDDAFVPRENLVGQVEGGWAVAMTTLMHERGNTGFQYAVTLRRQFDELVRTMKAAGVLGDSSVRRRLAQLYVETEGVRLNAVSGLSHELRNGDPGPRGSLPKWQFSEVDQAMTAFALDVLPSSVLQEDPRWERRFLVARGDSIMGGTTEIQKNVIAERVLGLPRLKR